MENNSTKLNYIGMVFPNIDLTNVRGVLVDVDNTLYPYEPAHQKAIRQCYNTFTDAFGNHFSFDDFYNKYHQKRTIVTKRLNPQGACRSRLFAFQALFEDMNIKQAFNKALEFETLYWDTLIENMELFQDSERFLNECQQKKIKVCAVSDMQAHVQVCKLQTLGLDHLIDYLVTSEEVGAEKPASIIFETALQKLGLTSDDVIMIGDNEEKDIFGAEKLGIKSFLVEVLDD